MYSDIRKTVAHLNDHITRLNDEDITIDDYK